MFRLVVLSVLIVGLLLLMNEVNVDVLIRLLVLVKIVFGFVLWNCLIVLVSIVVFVVVLFVLIWLWKLLIVMMLMFIGGMFEEMLMMIGLWLFEW